MTAARPDDRPTFAEDDRNLTWAALLAAWTDFAKAAVALPKTAEGERWRRSVPLVIELQAAACALGDLHRLPERDRAAALDVAEALITSRAGRLREIWAAPSGEPDLPEAVLELILDAHSAASAARAALAGASS
jgi:hypothetical protein